MEWTIDEELTIGGIMGAETMHDPENTTGDRRISCTRIEGIRRLRRRTKAGAYVAPASAVLAAATVAVTPEHTEAQIAVFEAGRQRFQRSESIELGGNHPR
jgi:hypothetical protein